MPELPEVEAARRRLQRVVVGKKIRAAEAVHDPVLFRGITGPKLAAALVGRRIDAVKRRGKHLWFELDRRPWPTFHFGMTGSFEIYGAPDERPLYWRIELALAGGVRLAFRDPRRFGRIRLQDDPIREAPIALLGPDPLLDPPTTADLAALLARRKAPLKAVLLDQASFAGVGNWVADEILYQARLSPLRPGATLTRIEVAALRRALLAVVRGAVRVHADSERFPRTWLFHDRWGRAADARTARGEAIVHHTVGGRTTAWVPKRQK